MNVEQLRIYCLSKPNTSETFPFDEHTLVFKVYDKIFAITGLDNIDASVNLKCDPENAIDLRNRYSCVRPGYHQNKKHWNTVMLDGTVGDTMIKQWIDHSYELVLEKIPRRIKG